MYFPYFRGRQYELLALRDLAEKKLISQLIHPIIEPVKIIPSLNNCLTAFDAAKLPIGLILNPNVGDLTDDVETLSAIIDDCRTNAVVSPGILLNKASLETMQNLSREETLNNLIYVLNNRDFIESYEKIISDYPAQYTLCADSRKIRQVSQNKVLFEDRFTKQSRNADYPEDEFYSDDHLYYVDEDYLGFGDYSIVGSEYLETGFAPYAVAIHVVYFSGDDSLRIRHFISDSNDDISNVAGKFHEAVTKLHDWFIDGNQTQLTSGLQILLDHYHNGTYPGLPTLKKLSIMHHLELMNKYLTKE